MAQRRVFRGTKQCGFSVAERNKRRKRPDRGLKERTNSAFTKEKANLMEMRQLFNWELGYLYTSENHRGLGVASKIVVKLLNIHGDENLMASTEIEENPGMVKILERHGFEQKGETWKSGIHEDILGLYIKLK